MKKSGILFVAGIAVAALIIKPTPTPLYVVNLSPSVPVGLYRIESGNPGRGDLALIDLDQPWRGFAASRGYLWPGMRLIKPVAALAGDHVCRSGVNITINRRLAATAKLADEEGRALPEWRGCKTLVEGESFLLSNREGSFDGRYFGVTPRSAAIARALPVSVWFAEFFLSSIRSSQQGRRASRWFTP